MRRYVRSAKAKLPTIAVGGSLPSKEDDTKIKEETEQKISEYRKENPVKPESHEKPLNMPLEMKSNPLSLEREYIELAKKMLRIPQERNPSILEMAKAVISEMEKKNALIEKLSKPRNDGFNSVLSSSQSNGFWN